MEEIGFLALTLFVEIPVAYSVMPNASRKRAAWIVVFLNMVTHPVAWFFASSGISWLAVESAVLIAETAALPAFFPQARKQAILAAVLMNALSAGIGAAFF